MYRKRFETVRRTFYNSRFSFNQVEYLYASLGVVRYGYGEPVSPGFDKFGIVQTCTFFAPSVVLGDRLEAVAVVPYYFVRIALPVDNVRGVADVDGPWFPVEAHASPVPHLEGEDVGSSADFQHHGSCARAVYRAARNQVMVVLASREPVDVAFGIERRSLLLSRVEGRNHFLGIDALLYSEIDAGASFGIK